MDRESNRVYCICKREYEESEKIKTENQGGTESRQRLSMTQKSQCASQEAVS